MFARIYTEYHGTLVPVPGIYHMGEAGDGLDVERLWEEVDERQGL